MVLLARILAGDPRRREYLERRWGRQHHLPRDDDRN